MMLDERRERLLVAELGAQVCLRIASWRFPHTHAQNTTFDG